MYQLPRWGLPSDEPQTECARPWQTPLGALGIAHPSCTRSTSKRRRSHRKVSRGDLSVDAMGFEVLPAPSRPVTQAGVGARATSSSGRWGACGRVFWGRRPASSRAVPSAPPPLGSHRALHVQEDPGGSSKPKPQWASPAPTGRVLAEGRDIRPGGRTHPAGSRAQLQRQSRQPQSTWSLGPTGSLGLEPPRPSGRVPASRLPGTESPAWNALPPQVWAWLHSEARLPSTPSSTPCLLPLVWVTTALSPPVSHAT